MGLVWVTWANMSWCPLSLAGAQTTQLFIEPPWRPAVLWDQVTLTCQGSRTASDTTWYKDRQRWGPKGPNHLTVTEKGTYECDRPGSGRSPPVTVLNDNLVLQVPARALLEGDTVTLHCRHRQNKQLTSVSFYHEEKQLKGPQDGTKLFLSPLQLNHSGRYHCRGWVPSYWSESKRVTVTVHSECSDGDRKAQHPPRASPPLPESFIPPIIPPWVTQNFPSPSWFPP
ncbi:Fc receptor-like A [Serinus canaria]|uniref:Fc receptor-like A n=1 Tax=Serinus canaria TaxID=9135 RepID=UPI0021CCA0D1|nr:Fc receptor-like A [Serinus canaria]